MAWLKLLSLNRSFFWCSVKQYSPVTRTWHLQPVSRLLSKSLRIALADWEQKQMKNSEGISIYSALVLPSHSSSMPPTNFLSFTKYFWCCPYYNFFFIQVTCMRSISWTHFWLCFQISFSIVEALQRLKWEKSIVCTWFFFVVAECVLPGFSACSQNCHGIW